MDYGKELAATLRQGATGFDFAAHAGDFGTSDIGLILARTTQGLQRAQAVEARLCESLPGWTGPETQGHLVPVQAAPTPAARHVEAGWLGRKPNRAFPGRLPSPNARLRPMDTINLPRRTAATLPALRLTQRDSTGSPGTPR